ncbi:serine protease [Streptomyces bohaiensis]|uniref:Serine protease n=2 Tax=Streptomyces bohaiensis TaxID=1431344 RepID=A0ABX1CBS5_9ACTN|nr:serine protease [Streptomyces bohaiensis]NJQ16561.1 serine protease [Streptomyces bohaiensis]
MAEPHPADPVLLPAVRDLAGRPRGRGFLADDHGTVITSHEAVDGLARVVIHPEHGAPCVVPAADVTPLPEWNLALVRVPGLTGRAPLLIGSARAECDRTPVRIPLDAWAESVVTGAGPATYTATDRFHPLPCVLRLDVPEPRTVRLRLNHEVTGGPVLAVDTGAVVAVLGTALHSGEHGGAFAVPLPEAAEAEPDGPLAAVLRRNALLVAGDGADLNTAGALAICSRTLPPRRPLPAAAAATRRPEAAAALREFDSSDRTVLALVGPPGTGRSTVLVAHTAHRAAPERTAPTVWLRGADLEAGDRGIRDALRRTLARAAAADAGTLPRPSGCAPAPAQVPDPDVLARVARRSGRSLLVVVDTPEEMPAALVPDLAHWAAASAAWLRAAGARLVIACRPEFWEHAGGHFAADSLRGGPAPAAAAGIALPACHWLGDLPPVQATGVREALGLGSAVDPAERRHPLSLRMLADIRASQHSTGRELGAPDRQQIFAAHLDLTALRVAERFRPDLSGTALRRLAAQVQARLHEAARQSLGPVVLPRAAFELLFPTADGWAAAVLSEGVLAAAGPAYRFTDEEFADWLQGRHLDLDATLDHLLTAPEPDPAADTPPPVPRHRIGPVVFALLRAERELGAESLRHRLHRLLDALAALGTAAPEIAPDPLPEAPASRSGAPSPQTPATTVTGRDVRWWCVHLLGETLLRLPDATGQRDAARRLAALVGDGRTPAADFPGPFWRRMRLSTADRLELLRLALPAGGPHEDDPEAPTATAAPRAAARARNSYAAAAGELLATDPDGARPVLCRWLADDRVLPSGSAPNDASPAGPGTTIADVAHRLLTGRRSAAPSALADALVDEGHPRCRALLADLVRLDPAGLCEAVVRWSADPLPERRRAAADHLGLLDSAVPKGASAPRDQLRRAARRLARHQDEPRLRAAAYRVLVGDPLTRGGYLPEALAHLVRYADGSAGDSALACAVAAEAHSAPCRVLAAFRLRLHQSGADPATAATTLAALASIGTPALARPVAALVAEFATLPAPHAAQTVAAFVRTRLAQGDAARATLTALVEALGRTAAAAVRAAVARSLVEVDTADAAYLAQLVVHPGRRPTLSAPGPGAGEARSAPTPSGADLVPCARPGAAVDARPVPHPARERTAAPVGGAGPSAAAPLGGDATPVPPADAPRVPSARRADRLDHTALEGIVLPSEAAGPPHTGPRRVEAPDGRYF